MPNAKIVRKNAYMGVSESLPRTPKVGLFVIFWVLFYLIMQRDLKQKHFSK